MVQCKWVEINSDSSLLLFCKSKHEREEAQSQRKRSKRHGKEASSIEGAPMTVGTLRLFAMPPVATKKIREIEKENTPRLTRSFMPLSAKAFRDREIRDHKANLNRRPRAPANWVSKSVARSERTRQLKITFRFAVRAHHFLWFEKFHGWLIPLFYCRLFFDPDSFPNVCRRGSDISLHLHSADVTLAGIRIQSRGFPFSLVRRSLCEPGAGAESF